MKLSPCPFCGSPAEIVGGPEDWHPTPYDPDSGGDPYGVVCTGCPAEMHFTYDDEIDDVERQWNSRV